jgi:ketosteroid isomerase-like protein
MPLARRAERRNGTAATWLSLDPCRHEDQVRKRGEHHMTASEIGQQYVALLKEQKFDEALEELFASDAVSVEAFAPTGVDRAASGKDAIRAKGARWARDHVIHGFEISGPYPNGERFAVRMVMDVTNKPSGQRMSMDEIGLFTVESGKITREEFFYAVGP